jgi:hypothetical protein
MRDPVEQLPKTETGAEGIEGRIEGTLSEDPSLPTLEVSVVVALVAAAVAAAGLSAVDGSAAVGGGFVVERQVAQPLGLFAPPPPPASPS